MSQQQHHPFTIPLLQRIIRFSQLTPVEVILLSYVDTTFRETLIDYETAHLVFEKCSYNEIRNFPSANSGWSNRYSAETKHRACAHDLQAILNHACRCSNPEKSGLQWLIPVLLEVPIMRPMFRIYRDQAAWMYGSYESKPPLFIAIENRNFYAINVIVDFALKYLDEDRKCTSSSSNKSKQRSASEDDSSVTSSLSPKMRTHRYHFACEIKNQLVGHVGEKYSMFDFLTVPEYHFHQSSSCMTENNESNNTKKEKLSIDIVLENEDHYYNRNFKEKLELAQFFFAKLQKFKPQTPNTKEMKLDAMFLMTRSSSGENLLIRWLKDFKAGILKSLENNYWLLSAAEKLDSESSSSTSTDDRKHNSSNSNRNSKLKSSSTSVLEALLAKRATDQTTPLLLATFWADRSNTKENNFALVKMLFDKIQSVSKEFLKEQLTMSHSIGPCPRPGHVFGDGPLPLLVRAVLINDVGINTLNEILKRSVVAGIRFEALSFKDMTTYAVFNRATLVQFVFKKSRRSVSDKFNIFRLIVAFCKDETEFQQVARPKETLEVANEISVVNNKELDQTVQSLKDGDCLRKSKEWYKEYFDEEVYIGE